MSIVEQILKQVSNLPQDQKLTLASRILESAESLTDSVVNVLWDDEIRQRIARYEQGETSSVPVSEVFARLDAKLKK